MFWFLDLNVFFKSLSRLVSWWELSVFITMNRPKPTTLRRPSAAKPSGIVLLNIILTVNIKRRRRTTSCWSHFAGHPPPGDFIALGSKSQGGEPKAPAVLLKPAAAGLPTDRKRESSTLPSSSGLSSLTKRPKLSTTPPVSALGRLADVAAVDKRAISPSIKEPSVLPIEGEACFKHDIKLIPRVAQIKVFTSFARQLHFKFTKSLFCQDYFTLTPGSECVLFRCSW